MNTSSVTVTAETAQAEATELTGSKHPCSCQDGCPGLTTRFFSQGHDARLVTRLRNAVQAGELPIAEAFAEIVKRGGTERLQLKLDAAVANASKPKAKKARAASTPKLPPLELDGFSLVAIPQATRPVTAKVGRWSYEGTLRTHRSAEEGATKDDTFMVFEYVAKSGELTETTKYKDAADLPILVSLRGDAAAEAAREEVAEIPQNAFENRVATPAPGFEAPADEPENTDDIPF